MDEDNEEDLLGRAAQDVPSSRWDDAVETFRDREKMKQSRKERLLEAWGDVERMGTATEKADPAADVKWRGAGGQREWDKGKNPQSEDA